MNYKAPHYVDLGEIGAPMNPMFVSDAIALGPTQVIDAPNAGFAVSPHYGLDGRHFDRHFFEPGWQINGRQFDRNYFEVGTWQMHGWRDAMDVFAAAQFLFPG